MKKILLFILMIALVVSCAVTGVAFAGTEANRNFDVTYTSQFTGTATTENPGYLVFDKPLDATGGSIEMTMDIAKDTDLTGKFNLGFAIMSSADANPMNSANSMVWYNSTTSPSGKFNMGSLAAGNGFPNPDPNDPNPLLAEITGKTTSKKGLYYKTGQHIKEGNSIKVVYVAPTLTGEGDDAVETKGSIALYKKTTGSDNDWAIVTIYEEIPYSVMPQSDNLYFGIMGWWESNSNASSKEFNFSMPKATDGTTTSTILNARGNMSYAPYSNFEDVPDDYTTSYRFTWGQDTRTDQGYSTDADLNKYPQFVENGIGTVAQGYFGNAKPANLADDEALVMEFNVNNYNIGENTSFGFGVMSPAANKTNVYDYDDFYANRWIGTDASSIFVFGRQNSGQMNITGWRMTNPAFPGNTSYTDGASTMYYSFRPKDFMDKDMSVKLVYTPYVAGATSEDTKLGSLIMYSKSSSAPESEYKVAWSVSELGERALSDNLYIVMYVNNGAGYQSLTVSNYSISVRKIDGERDANGVNIQTSDVVTTLDKSGTCTRKAFANSNGAYVYYVSMTEVRPTIVEGDNGDGVIIYADRYNPVNNKFEDKAYSALFYSHGNIVNDKLSTLAEIKFDVTVNDGLQLLFSKDKTVQNSIAMNVPSLETTRVETVDGNVTTLVTNRPTGKYFLDFAEVSGKTYATLYAYYNETTKTTTTQDGADDLVEEVTVSKLVKLDDTTMEMAIGTEALDEYYLAFFVETEDEAKIAVIDNFEVTDDPAVIGVIEHDYVCTFDMGLPPSKFSTVTAGARSFADITDRNHTVAVTNATIIGKDVYNMLVSDGEKITIKADDAPKGKHFDRWETSTGEVFSRSEEVSINVAFNVIVTAKYELDEYQIIILDTEEGASVAGKSGAIVFYNGEDKNLTSLDVKYGDSVKVVAYEDTREGFVFDGWYNGKDKVSSDKEFAFDVSADYKELQARYAPLQITIRVINGLVKSDEPDGEAVSTITKTAGEEITVVPNAVKTGWEFSHWEMDGVIVDGDDVILGDDNSYSFTLTASGELTAVFKKFTYTVKVTDGYINGIAGLKEDTLEHGDKVMITANAPEAGKTFDGWYVGTKKVSSDADYLTTVTSDLTIVAKYVDADDSANSGCAGFIAPPTSNGGGNNSLWVVAGVLVMCAVAVAILRRNRAVKSSK